MRKQVCLGHILCVFSNTCKRNGASSTANPSHHNGYSQSSIPPQRFGSTTAVPNQHCMSHHPANLISFQSTPRCSQRTATTTTTQSRTSANWWWFQNVKLFRVQSIVSELYVGVREKTLCVCVYFKMWLENVMVMLCKIEKVGVVKSQQKTRRRKRRKASKNLPACSAWIAKKEEESPGAALQRGISHVVVVLVVVVVNALMCSFIATQSTKFLMVMVAHGPTRMPCV